MCAKIVVFCIQTPDVFVKSGNTPQERGWPDLAQLCDSLFIFMKFD